MRKPRFILAIGKDDHFPVFDVKIPYGFEFVANDWFISFSTSFKHLMFVTKSCDFRLLIMVIHNFENSRMIRLLYYITNYKYNNITLMAKQRSNQRPAITALADFGKVPPQANDMEEAVLGAVMLEKEAVITILDILKPESFYREAHQKIFKAISDLSAREFPVDLYTVTEELRAS